MLALEPSEPVVTLQILPSEISESVAWAAVPPPPRCAPDVTMITRSVLMGVGGTKAGQLDNCDMCCLRYSLPRLASLLLRRCYHHRHNVPLDVALITRVTICPMYSDVTMAARLVHVTYTVASGARPGVQRARRHYDHTISPSGRGRCQGGSVR